jgi:exodeoxyribonuclease-3
VRLATYNVNSIKARLPRLLAFLDVHHPDVVCVQETKSAPEAFPHEALAGVGYMAADLSGGRWEGVAILARNELGVSDVTRGLVGEPDADQARWVEATVGGVRIVSVYAPNGQALDSPAFADKLLFFDAMVQRMAGLTGMPAVVAGDLNVCPTDLDVWEVADVHGGTHVTDAERSRFRAMLEAGYVDSFRRANPDEPGFTWWDYRAGHFHKGFGLRIDHVLASAELADCIESAAVIRDFRKPSTVPESKPSDHAPVVVDFAD